MSRWSTALRGYVILTEFLYLPESDGKEKRIAKKSH